MYIYVYFFIEHTIRVKGVKPRMGALGPQVKPGYSQERYYFIAITRILPGEVLFTNDTDGTVQRSVAYTSHYFRGNNRHYKKSCS